MQQGDTHPVRFAVDYPDRDLDRVTTFFRLFTAIPILIVLGTVSGGTWQWSYERGERWPRGLAACCSPGRCS